MCGCTEAMQAPSTRFAAVFGMYQYAGLDKSSFESQLINLLWCGCLCMFTSASDCVASDLLNCERASGSRIQNVIAFHLQKFEILIYEAWLRHSSPNSEHAHTTFLQCWVQLVLYVYLAPFAAVTRRAARLAGKLTCYTLYAQIIASRFANQASYPGVHVPIRMLCLCRACSTSMYASELIQFVDLNN